MASAASNPKSSTATPPPRPDQEVIAEAELTSRLHRASDGALELEVRARFLGPSPAPRLATLESSQAGDPPPNPDPRTDLPGPSSPSKLPSGQASAELRRAADGGVQIWLSGVLDLATPVRG